MPVRTYDSLDVINYLESDSISDSVTGNGVASHVITPIAAFRFTIVPSGTIGNTLVGSQSRIFGFFSAVGDIDYSLFPTIPVNSIVDSLTVKLSFTCNVAANTSSGVPDVMSAAAFIQSTLGILPVGVNLPTLAFSDTDSQIGVISASASVAGSVTFSVEEVINFPGGLALATFIADYATLTYDLTVDFDISNAVVPSAPTPGSIIGGITLDNFQFAVDYHDAGITISLDPAGGPVEIGQNITATGPGAAELEYVALQGDLVIPIEPKIIGPDEVLLEVPYPATDPCFDCFGDCPNCEDAFTPCDEDLTGEACQAAMQACLDCLAECLEDLQEAEECQESTGNPPDTPTPIVIICGGPEFSGSVVLGNFTILVANGSGLYKFSLGKLNDTIYTAERDGTTYDVKIPNPGAKTGFFRS